MLYGGKSITFGTMYSAMSACVQVHRRFCLFDRVSQCVSNLLFFNVHIIRQAHLPPKVPKQANFRGSLQKKHAEIE